MASERYNRICEIVQSGWIIGCPVELNKGALLIDNVSKQVILQVSLRNVSEAVIKQVDLLIHRYDLAGDPVSDSEPAVKYSLADLTEQPRALFGEKSAILLGANSTRQVKIIFKRVILADGTVWRNENDSSGDPYPLQALSSVLSSELVVQFNREYDARYPVSRQTAGNRVHSYVPIFTDRVWVCTCGFPNDKATAKCGRCQVEKEWLQNATHEPYLADQLSAYLAEQARLEKIRQEETEERARRMKAEEAEHLRTQKEKDEKERIRLAVGVAKNKHRKRTATLILSAFGLVSIALILVVIIIIMPAKNKNNFDAGVTYLSNGEFDNAATYFSKLPANENYKVKVEKSYFETGNLFFASKKYDEALKCYEQVDPSLFPDLQEKITEAKHELSNLSLETEPDANPVPSPSPELTSIPTPQISPTIAPTPTIVPTPTVTPKPVKIEKQYGYITDTMAATSGNSGGISIDYIEFYSGDLAVTKAIEDNSPNLSVDEDGRLSVDNDYYIRNNNPRLRDFLLSPKCKIQLLDLSGASIEWKTVSFKQFAKYIDTQNFDPEEEYEFLMLITIQDNYVIAIKEQYLP